MGGKETHTPTAMRQTTLTGGLVLSGRPPDRSTGISALIGTLNAEEDLAFYCVLPSGTTLKCISELLLRCAPNASVTVDATGMVFVACDPASGRLIHIELRAADMLRYRFLGTNPPLRSILECSSLHSVFGQLKRKDQGRASFSSGMVITKRRSSGSSSTPPTAESGGASSTIRRPGTT